MDRPQEAAALFDEGYNCAQSVLAVFCEDYGVPRQTAFRLAAPFGGGLSRTDGLCGAAAGAVMVLGLLAGHDDPQDETAQDRVRQLTQEFLRRYAERLGSTRCTDILGYDLSQPGVAEKVNEEDLSKEPCTAAVRCAVEVLGEMVGDAPSCHRVSRWERSEQNNPG